jgi:competence protein ComEA
MLHRFVALLLFLFSAAAFAAVDVNKATQADLESIKGIGPVIATKILDERKKASFKDWDDMITRVKGLGEHNATRFSADGLTVNGSQYAGAPAGHEKASKSEGRSAHAGARDKAGTKGSASAPDKLASAPKK